MTMTHRPTSAPALRSRVQAALRIRRLVSVAALTLAWCGLWQTLSPANLVSGVTLSVLVLSSGVGTAGRGAIRMIPLAKLLWAILVDLVISTIDVAREILRPGRTTNEAIIAVGVPSQARHHLLLLIVAITLTPGTAVVDADPDTGTLYLHLLRIDQADEVRAHVATIAHLVDEALPVAGPPVLKQRSAS